VAGPRHVVGPPWVDNAQGELLSAIVNPGPGDHLRTTGLGQLAGYWGARGPYYGYLGWGVLVFIAISFPVWRKTILAWCAVATGVWAWALSWGVPAFGSGWRPWSVFNAMPVVSDIRPFRFTDVVAFSAALLLAICLDGWWKLATAKAALRRSRARSFLGSCSELCPSP